MKTNSIKVLGIIASTALATAALSPRAQAVPITGNITLAGGATFDTSSLSTATKVASFQNVEVQSRDGSFAPFVSVLDNVTMAPTWTFNPSTPVPALWSVDGFTFDETSSVVFTPRSDGFLYVTGIGILSGNGFDPTPGTWSFTSQSPSASRVFSFSASGAAVPDGGATVVLLGLGLIGVAGFRSKLSSATLPAS